MQEKITERIHKARKFYQIDRYQMALGDFRKG